ncbi:MAG: SdrD B-like domain-containing protein, partial [Gemmatimonadaceae bacterium]
TTDASIDFGFTQGTGTIGDFVWDDLNGNGVQDAGEPGLAGITVTLSGAATATTTTDANGNYVFGSLFAGNYTVTLATPSGYSATPSNQGGDPLKDSDNSPVNVPLATNSTSRLGTDFGFKQNVAGEIGDFVWYDVNENGVQDVAEPGISGRTVTLTGPGGPRTTTTDGTGHYVFTGLSAGNYTVSVATPNGFIPTPSMQGVDPLKDSNGSPASVSLATNTSVDLSVDIGFTQGNGAIGDFVWEDTNGNGVQDAGEPGLAGVSVALSGAGTGTTTTDGTGHYVFGSLFAGTYTVTISTPVGYSPSPSNQGGDPLKDSNASPATVTLATNASSDLSVDAGFVVNLTGQVGDFVWYDVNGNGVQDAAEPGIAGLTVSLTGPGGPQTTTTDATGHYLFAGLAAGGYSVSVATPSGFVPTPGTQGGDPLKDSNGSPASVNLATASTTDASIDFGFTQGTGTIGNFVWDDLNGNGVQDAGEPGLSGVSVVLSGSASANTTTDGSGAYAFNNLFSGSYTLTVATPSGYSPTPSAQGGDPLKDSNGSPTTVSLATNSSTDLDADFGFKQNQSGQVGDFVWSDLNGDGVQGAGEPGIAGLTVTLTGPGGPRTTTTDGTGQYLFTGLAAGSYSISIATPSGFVPTTANAPGSNSGNDSDGSPAAVSLATASSSDMTIDFGFKPGAGTIGDFVWNDSNGNGVQDTGEPGLAGVTVTLSGAASATTTTAANGSYSFDNLVAGTYTVTVSTPIGFAASPSGQGSDPLKDSNGSPANVTLATNTSTNAGIDFGFVASTTSQIGDFVWYDVNGDGVQDSGEAGLAGVTVTLSGPGGPKTTTTDATGHYLFTALAAGSFTVTVTTPSGYVLSPSTQGGDPLKDSNGSPASVALASSSSNVSIDVGYTKGTGTIGDFVWKDLNANGIQDAGEPGLSGVTVALSGAKSATTTTASNGSYTFSSLFAGNYTVTVTKPSGYSPTLSAQGSDPLKDSNGSPATVTLATNSTASPGIDFGFVVGAQIITLDQTSTANSGAALVTSLTWNHTVTATGTNRILLVSVGIRNKSNQTVSSVKWGTASLRLIKAISTGSNVRSEMWYLINPPSGLKTITVTLAGAGAGIAAGAVSYTGVHQTTPLGTSVTKSIPSNLFESLNVTSAVGQVVVDAVVKQNFTESQNSNSGQVQRWLSQTSRAPGAESIVVTSAEKPGAATVSIGWSSSAARPWAAVAVPLKQAP